MSFYSINQHTCSFFSCRSIILSKYFKIRQSRHFLSNFENTCTCIKNRERKTFINNFIVLELFEILSDIFKFSRSASFRFLADIMYIKVLFTLMSNVTRSPRVVEANCTKMQLIKGFDFAQAKFNL